MPCFPGMLHRTQMSGVLCLRVWMRMRRQVPMSMYTRYLHDMPGTQTSTYIDPAVHCSTLHVLDITFKQTNMHAYTACMPMPTQVPACFRTYIAPHHMRHHITSHHLIYTKTNEQHCLTLTGHMTYITLHCIAEHFQRMLPKGTNKKWHSQKPAGATGSSVG